MKNMERDIGIGLASYKKNIKKNWIVLAILFILLVLSLILSINLGSANLTFVETIKGFFGCGSDLANATIWKIRMPEIVAAIVCGAGLALAGNVMQTCLRNPLASPSTIGVGSAATLGANVAIIGFSLMGVTASQWFENSAFAPYLVTICAFIFAFGAVLLVMLISKFLHFSPESIILTGTAFSALFGAGTTLLQYFGDETQVSAAVFWTFGDLANVHWPEILVISIVVALGFIFFMIQSWDYNVMITGEESAKSLGLKTSVIRFLGLLVATLLTAVIVSFVGMIGFVGLVAPQIMKRIVGSDQRFLMPASALAGSTLLLLADVLSRMLIAPVTLPIGAITSLIGAPMFIFILLKGLRKR